MKFFLILLISIGTKSREGKVIFRIEDAYTGKKIFAEIKVIRNGNLITKVKADGKYEFLLPEGKYDFYFEAENYLPLSTYFYINEKETLNVNCLLVPVKRENIFPEKRENLTGIRGYVTDEDGKPLKNAQVILKGKKLKTFTDDEGIFEFWIEVPQKEYSSPFDIPKDTIILNLEGYKKILREIILIPENVILKIKMEKGEGEKFIPEIRGKGTGEKEILPYKREFEGKIEEGILRVVLDPPPSIRVGKLVIVGHAQMWLLCH